MVPLPFEEEKKVSTQMLLDFVPFLGFILGDGFLKLKVERGNM